MTVLSALYQLFIGPLELFFEVVFAFAQRITDDPGLSIIFLSLAMNFLVLPLYRRADAMQEAERDRAAAMRPWVDHIKKTFAGDERFMMLQAYYRQVGYRQTDSLRGSVSLLLEIPFFIAAYHFLSNLDLLHGVRLGPIADLGAPDALIAFGDVTINALPLIMTALNLISAAIYMKGFPVSSKVQMYGIAAIFLILLYNSPAGLVFYWTLNNLFSLVKNVFYKLKNPARVLCVLVSAVSIICLVVVLFVHPMSNMRRQVGVIVFLLILQLPLIVHLVRRGRPRRQGKPATKADDRAFLLSGILLAVLTGLLIPSAVITDSPLEFSEAVGYTSPLWYVLDSALLATGTFVIWFGIFYWLASPTSKRAFAIGMWAFAGIAVINYMFFGTGYGNLSPTLQFDIQPRPALAEMLVNVAAIVAVAAVFVFVWKKKRTIVGPAALVICIALVGMSALNVRAIAIEVASLSPALEAAQARAEIPLSKSGKNVVVLMMDRMVSEYLPAIMKEKPEMKDVLDGFTFYPNVTSFGSKTNCGVPGVYGGYEYTPEAMNARDDLTLAQKHDEALKVMPYLFDDNGYQVTVCDPTYAGYSWVPELSIYNDHPNINAYITMNGRYSVKGFEDVSGAARTDAALKRNLFCYGLFKIAPVAIQPTLYAKGTYNGIDAVSSGQTPEGPSASVGLDGGFMNAFGVLDSLTDITSITDQGTGTFLMMSNNSTHDPMLMQTPDYIPSWTVDNRQYDAEHPGRFKGNRDDRPDEFRAAHYHVNMASLLKLGEWFAYMKENGVYDNTRIIITSDHGEALGVNESLILPPQDDKHGEVHDWDVSAFNCVLLVKDFGAHGFTTSDTFMTNADTPTIAMNGVIDNPVNPFTGRKIDSSAKNPSDTHVMYVDTWSIDKNSGNTFLPSRWFSVHDDVRDGKNWKYIGKQ